MNSRIIFTASVALAFAGPAFAHDSQSKACAPATTPATAPQPVPMTYYDPSHDNQTKVYPRVDRGHVPGDPPVIDHSMDNAPVPPPVSSITLMTQGG